MSANRYRDLPSVDALAGSIDTWLPRRLVVDVCRAALDQARSDLSSGLSPDIQALAAGLVRVMERSAGEPVINATGVLLHTNLGRAPWSNGAIDRATRAAAGYTNLEIDIDTGDRNRRGQYIERLLIELTGAEAAFVVNNNAAALLISLAALAGGHAVPVARGELIEIGGSYRLPDVMTASGVRLVEVGTTNRTRVGDYEIAIQTHHCAALLKVHPSNYRVEGFVEEASVSDLAKLAARHDLALINDIGSGLLDSDAAWLPKWLKGEPGARQSLGDGAGVVTFSGDKLLGGPQAGILVGSASHIDRIRRHPLARALRVDAVTYAALGATLEKHLDGPPLGIPFWERALTGEEELRERCRKLVTRVGGIVFDGSSTVGAGSAPGMLIPTPQIRLQDRDDLYEALLHLEQPVLTRREHGDLIIDLRAVDPGDDDVVAASIIRCL